MSNGNLWRQARTVVCPTCNATVGAYCTTRTGRIAESPHTARIAAGAPKLTEEELVERARQDAMFAAQRAASVRTTFVLSCGEVLPESEPIPIREWPITEPGRVMVCEEHDDYSILVEVRTRLVLDRPTITRLYQTAGLGLDDVTIDSLAEQDVEEAPR